MSYFGSYFSGYFGGYFGQTGTTSAPVVVPPVPVRRRPRLDVSRDFEVWDDLEPVKLTSTRRPGSAVDYVPSALRRQLTRREQAASWGVYRGGDVIWEIPRILVNLGRLKPGDVITDRDEEDYTVLVADEAVDRTVWTLHCRNLAVAEDLRQRCDVELCAEAVSPTGARLKRWPSDANPGGAVPYRNLACRFQPSETEVGEERGIRGNRTRGTLFLAREVAVDFDSMRVRLGPRYFEMVAYRHSEELGELPQLDVAEAP